MLPHAKSSVHDKTAFVTVPDYFWVTFGILISHHMSDVSDDAKHEVIHGLFLAKMTMSTYSYAASKVKY